MKKARLSLFAILLAAVAVSGQDTKPFDFESYTQVKDAVRRITTQHLYTGWDEKTFNRAGDLAAVAIVKSVPESTLTSPTTMKDVLAILQSAFACPSRCITSLGNRQPEVAMLLLEHLHNHTSGPLQSEVDDTREIIVRRIQSAE